MRCRLALAAGLFALSVAHAAAAGDGFKTYQPVTPASRVEHLRTPPCIVDLFRNRAFAGDAPFLGSYAPKCPGPWSRVLLRLDTRIKGTQYDRMGAVWLNRSELLRFTTAEPTKHGIAYSIEKDVTPYAALFSAPGSVVVELANYVNKKYDGVYHLDASLEFYRSRDAARAAALPDEVVPVDDELSAIPWNTSGTLTETIGTLPRNLVRARLDVFASNHGCDEFWYSNVPDAYAKAHKSDGLCGGGTYREIDLAIDGKPASAVYPFPYIWTGGINPLLWRPLSAIDALNVPQYQVDLDPWAGVLSDGKPHTIALTVLNDRGLWPLDANLLLWRDARRARTGGRIVRQDVPLPSVQSMDRLGQNGGTLTQIARSAWHVNGYVDTSAGRVWHALDTRMQFENGQLLKLRSGEQYSSQVTTFWTTVTTRTKWKTHQFTTLTAYPLTVNSAYPPPARTKPYALVIDAWVRQQRLVVSVPSACSTTVDAHATLKRLPDGSDAVATGTTNEVRNCVGSHRLRKSVRSRDGVLLRP